MIIMIILFVWGYTLVIDWISWEINCDRPMGVDEVIRTCRDGSPLKDVLFPIGHIAFGLLGLLAGGIISSKS